MGFENYLLRIVTLLVGICGLLVMPYVLSRHIEKMSMEKMKNAEETSTVQETVEEMTADTESAATEAEPPVTVVKYDISGDMVLGNKHEYAAEAAYTETAPLQESPYAAMGKYAVSGLAVIMIGAWLIIKAVLKYKKETEKAEQ